LLTQERKDHILQLLEENRRVVAKELSHALDVSEDTIRRDLRELAAEGRLQRVHGGALPASPALADFAGRERIASDAKVVIGRAAARMVTPGQVVFIDGGTTAVQLARSLPRDLRATVVTHSPSVAVELVQHKAIDVELIGGRLFKHSIVTVGTTAAEAISRIRADIYFMGVTGVHREIGLTTGDAEEAAVKRRLVEQAAETVVLASHEKLEAASPFVICALSDIATIVVEKDVPQEALAHYRQLGISIVRA
jgi:DeoR/GlpR family transcriptional regulator of sugar metabolism